MGFESVKVTLRFNGHSFVPETPVDIPAGTLVEGWTLPSAPQETWGEFVARTAGSWEDFELEESDDPPARPVEVDF
ncbi:hypothetical protein EON81_01890 [bacterium]|nr:MAG: hypothetical protein EON81_01890 [bacterium]